MIIIGTVAAGDADVLAAEQPAQIPIVFLGRRVGAVVHLGRAGEVLVAVGGVEWALQNHEPLRLDARLARAGRDVIVTEVVATHDEEGDAVLGEGWSELDGDELSPLLAGAVRSARHTRRERGAPTMAIADLDERLVAPTLPPAPTELGQLLSDLSQHPAAKMALPTHRRWHIGPNGPTLAPCPPGTPIYSSRQAAHDAWREIRPQVRQRPEIRQPGG